MKNFSNKNSKKATNIQLNNPIKIKIINEKSEFKWYDLSKIKQGKAKIIAKSKKVLVCFCFKTPILLAKYPSVSKKIVNNGIKQTLNNPF